MNDEEIRALIIERSQVLAAQAEREAFRASLIKQIEAKIPKEILDEIEAVKAEFDTSDMSARVAELEQQITAAVLEAGHTVKVEKVSQAIYNQGRVSWETAQLDGLMIAFPELAKLRKVGKPFVSFR